jgi:transposase
MRKKATNPVKKTREESLEEEISNLRAALSYSELRNEALHEVLKIGKEKYGIDLLKKAGAKQ